MNRIGIVLAAVALAVGSIFVTQHRADAQPPTQYVKDNIDTLYLGGANGILLDGQAFTDAGNAGTQTWTSNGYPGGRSGILSIVTTGANETRILSAPSYAGQNVIVVGKTITATNNCVITTNSSALVFSLNAHGDTVRLCGVSANGTLKWRIVGAYGAVGVGPGVESSGTGGPGLGQVTAHTGAAYTITPLDFNSWHTTTANSNATVTFTLPAPQASFTGTWVGIKNTATGVSTALVVTGTASKMVIINSIATTTATFSTSSQIVGAGGMWICDGAKWILVNNVGTVTGS